MKMNPITTVESRAPKFVGRETTRPATRRAGVALVITLIMLSVITFMAVTFLVLSNRERGSVSTATDQVTVQFAADTALERAKAEVLASIIAATNDQAFDLMVSTNYINYGGFRSGIASYTNVNFISYANGNPLTGNDPLINLTNLLYNPRPPVFVVTNKLTGATDFRYYLDLNRNGRYDTNGFWPVMSSDPVNNPYVSTNGGTTASLASAAYSYFVGDPEWIGVLEHPEWPHGPNNKFIARYAYLVVPSGKTLDVNYLHNQAFSKALNAANDGYMRNEGVGAWEINLAAFLSDLNTNIWNRDNGSSALYYQYLQPSGNPNKGYAFQDALSLLSYRYSFNYNTLAGGVLANNIDAYSDGPLMFGTALPAGNDNPIRPWVGADNTNHYFTIQDFFDPNKTAVGMPTPNFINRITQAGTNTDSYDRYTYYRMLSQLGTDSSAPVDRRMNVNFKNIVDGAVVPGMETNTIGWTPLDFFTNAADKMIRTYTAAWYGANNAFSLTNIPVFVNGYFVYSPAVNRLLQLAANMYEATTNSIYPNMYRPYFSTRQGTNVYISGFTLVNPVDASILTIPIDLTDAGALAQVTAAPPHQPNVYGVPWIIGARKGFPNFNQIAVNNLFEITRRLKVSRQHLSDPVSTYTYQQQYLLAVSNAVAVEVWNSYRTNYNAPVQISVWNDLSYTLTNSDGYVAPPTRYAKAFIYTTNQWAGYGPNTLPAANSFVVPMVTNYAIIGNLVYSHASKTFLQTGTSTTFEPVSPAINWGVSITNRLRVIIQESASGRVLDYVQLNGLTSARDLNSDVAQITGSTIDKQLWDPTTGTGNGLMNGINFQLNASQGNNALSSVDWNYYGVDQAQGNTKQWEIDNYRAFFHLAQLYGNNINNTNLTQQVPFAPTLEMTRPISWQANDPLVHYTASDLFDTANANTPQLVKPPGGVITNLFKNIGSLNSRYSPWYGNPAKGAVDESDIDFALKDTAVMSSDSWDFPTNRFPGVGWLGRVHRGTPWQTVYLKAKDVLSTGFGGWTKWSGIANPIWATNMAPFNDRMLFDMFTASPGGNATRGLLSVNQTNLASWSALLSGVIVVTNNSSGSTNLGWRTIDPAGVYSSGGPLPPLAQIVQGINNARANTNTANGAVFVNHQFQSLGDILATPQLTELSPFLVTSNIITKQDAGGLTDEVLERIPQQVMSLLTLSHSPRFVVYAYAQALHPAEHSIVTGGPFSGLCTNYQVAAETATRAVVRLEGSPNPVYTKASPDLFGNYYPPRLVVEQFNVLPPD